MRGLKSTIPPPILNGWKQIANHLGKGVRTVQRYEHELALPIRRPAGKPGASVIATGVELDAWVNASPLRETFALRRELPDNGAALVGFKQVLAEHQRLRKDMAKFRGEMRTAMKLLRENLWVIQTRNADKSTDRSGILFPFEGGKRPLN